MAAQGMVPKKRKRVRKQTIVRGEQDRARKSTKTRKKKGVAAVSQQAYETPMSRIMGARNFTLGDMEEAQRSSLEGQSSFSILAGPERAAAVEQAYMLSENAKMVEEYAAYDAEYGAPKDTRSGFDRVRLPDKPSDIEKFNKELYLLTVRQNQHRKTGHANKQVRQLCLRSQMRLPIPDNYIGWCAETDLAEDQPPNTVDPCTLIGDAFLMTLQATEPYRDFEMEMATANLARKQSGDTAMLTLTDARCREIVALGFIQGAIGNTAHNPDPRYKARFFIMAGLSDRFGLYLFSDHADDILQYYVWVQQRKRA